MLTNSQIGQRIRSRRLELEMTLQDVADQVGVQNSTILRYEQGAIKRIKLPVIESIAYALHVNPSWLLGQTDDPIDYDDGELIADLSLNYLEAAGGDVRKAFQISKAVDNDAMREPPVPLSFPQPQPPILDDPDIRMIARAGKKMTPEQRENLRKYAQYMFPEAFKDDDT